MSRRIGAKGVLRASVRKVAGDCCEAMDQHFAPMQNIVRGVVMARRRGGSVW